MKLLNKLNLKSKPSQKETPKTLTIELSIDNTPSDTSDLRILAKDLATGAIVGKLNMRIDGEALFVSSVAVNEQYRGKNIAPYMYEYVQKHAKGFKQMSANVSLRNKSSLKLHKKAGFQANKNELVDEVLSSDKVVYDSSVFAKTINKETVVLTFQEAEPKTISLD